MKQNWVKKLLRNRNTNKSFFMVRNLIEKYSINLTKGSLFLGIKNIRKHAVFKWMDKKE